jgi:hypothetical protein
VGIYTWTRTLSGVRTVYQDFGVAISPLAFSRGFRTGGEKDERRGEVDRNPKAKREPLINGRHTLIVSQQSFPLLITIMCYGISIKINIAEKITLLYCTSSSNK